MELTENTFHFATYARKAFLTGGLELKKEILTALEKEYLGLELDKKPINKAKTEALNSIRLLWLRIVDDVRTIFQRQNECIYIPNLLTTGADLVY